MGTKDFKIDTAEMKNVEILEVGTWNGMPLTEKDLDEMASNFNNKVIEPFLNLDHDDKFTDKVKRALSVVSLGFVSQLKREGKKLIADFIQVPRKVAELIDSGMLKKRSVEFYRKGFKVNGEVFNNVLKAVSFFGADIPAVNSLSNDFDILLKSKEHAVTLSDNSESTKITFNKTNGGHSMETIEVSKKEYTDLVTFKSTSEPTLTKLQADNKVLVTSNDELSTNLKKAEVEVKELKTFKDEAIESNKVSLQKEADDFTSGLVKEGKLLPKFKADIVEDYIAKSVDADKLKSFKERMESADKVIELGELKKDKDGNDIADVAKMSNDEINDAIEIKMKKTNKSWEEIAPEFGLTVE